MFRLEILKNISFGVLYRAVKTRKICDIWYAWVKIPKKKKKTLIFCCAPLQNPLGVFKAKEIDEEIGQRVLELYNKGP